MPELLDDVLVPIDGGFRVAETDTHWIDVLAMMFNWRVAETPKRDPSGWDRAWCYVGRDAATFVRAVAAAKAWVASGEDEPRGWNKSLQTGEWRET